MATDTRWVQWGIFSPAFRPHCTKNPDNDRRLWVYPLENFQIMRDAVELRSQLVPYIYTAARVTYDTGIPSVIRPLYYDYPGSFIFTDSNELLFENLALLFTGKSATRQHKGMLQAAPTVLLPAYYYQLCYVTNYPLFQHIRELS
jgi:hypothetical protein